jgi:putative ABC transport system substrate-binding protein
MGNISGSASPHREVAEVAAQRGLEFLVLDVQTQPEIEPAFEQAVAWGAQLLVAQNVIPLNANPRQVPELALHARLPSASNRQFLEAGFLLSYSVPNNAFERRAAWYVSRILDGVPPGELPFERITDLTLAVNRSTLTHLGLTLPEHLALHVAEWVG